MRIAFLSTCDAPLLGYIIREFVREELSIAGVILDAKGQSEKDLRLHDERTGGRLPSVRLEEFESLHIPYYIVANHSSKVTGDLVRQLSLDLLVNAGTPRLLKPEVLDAPTVGVVNCHPGLLPRFRGCTCVEWAIYFDEQVGNAVHFMNERIDEGPIVCQEGLTFSKNDTYVDVRVKVYEHGNRLLARGVKKILVEGLTPSRLEPQGEGRHFGVIDHGKMQEVTRKLSQGDYAFQR